MDFGLLPSGGYNGLMNYVYMLRCSDESLYTGWTNDLTKRYRQHCLKKGAKYTRSKKRLKLVYCECFEDAGEARKREAVIKKMNKNDKERLLGKK